MRVLHITNFYPTDENPLFGVVVKEQIESLRKIGGIVDVHFINARKFGRFEYLRAAKEIRNISENYDIIHCHHPYSAFITLSIARVKKPVVTSFLSVLEGRSKFPFVEKLFYSHILKKSTAFIVKHDPYIGDKYPNKGFYVPNGVSMDFFTPCFESHSEVCKRIGVSPKNYALFVSARTIFRPEKRYDIFKKTIATVNKRYNLELHELHLTKAPRNLVPFYYMASQLHLLTSDFEGSPNSVKEALACNLPIVSTNVGNVKSMIGNIHGCYVSDSNDPNDLAELVAKVIQSSNSFNGRRFLEENGLTMNKTASKLHEIYENILSVALPNLAQP